MHTKQQLHKGPVHVPSPSEPVSWEFALEIPTRASPRALASEMKDPDASYLPLGPASIAEAALPSSFATSGRRRNTRFEAYVEYHLEASLTQQGSGSHHDTVTASLPLHIRAQPMPYPLTDFDLVRRSHPLSATSYRLVPGMEDAELTFKQKSKKFFGSSKVPMFGFTLHYDLPRVIQLDNPAPIPLRMRAVPDARRTSEVLRGAPQVIMLTWLEMVLKADTCVIAPGHFGSHTGEDTVKHRVVLPAAFAGGVPASVLKSMGRGVNGDGPVGKEAANQGAVDRPGSGSGSGSGSASGDAKRRSLEPPPPRDEQGGSSSSQATEQPARLEKEEIPAPGESSAAGAAAAPEAHDEPPPPAGESSSPPTYQPRAEDNPPPPHPAAAAPPPAKAEQPPAYQPAQAAQAPGATSRDPNRRGPLVIPSAWGNSITDTDDGSQWIDVGAALGLRLHETHATCRGESVARMALEPVSPGFTTYCIRHSHRLKWKIGMSVGGEKVEVETEGEVVVVGAAGGA